jgi:WD40 repeat protein
MSLRKNWMVLAFWAGGAACLALQFLFPCGIRSWTDRARPRVLEGPRLPVRALAFGRDGATLTAACYVTPDPGRWEVTVWDLETGHPAMPSAECMDNVRSLALAPGGRALAVAGQDQSLWLWETGAAQGRRLGEHHCHVDALALSGDGSVMAAVDAEDVVTLWDVASGQPRALCQAAGALALTFAPDGKTLAGGSWDHAVRLWDVATGEELGVLRGDIAVVAVAFSPDRRLLASGDLRGDVTLWDVAARTKRATLEATTDKVFLNDITALAFSPDGQTLALAINAEVQLWDTGTGRRMAVLEGHERKVMCLAFSPDGTRLASGGYDRTVRLWDVTRYRSGMP